MGIDGAPQNEVEGFSDTGFTHLLGKTGHLKILYKKNKLIYNS